MGVVRLYMSMSVDGFITGPEDGIEHGLGVGGERLHDWLGSGARGSGRPAGPAGGADATVFAEAMATGAVITGRRTFDHAGHWAGDHHDGVPVFVLSRTARPDVGHARHVADVESGVARAKAAAGDRDVLLHGASAAQAVLRAGLLDELELHLVPVLLGRGRRLFDNLPPDHVELDLVRVLDGNDVQHLRYRVRSKG
ncbi:dihydrofolate reductase family protein [Actinophytocola gossypii]|uniref:Dihydrofolate reductase family protein n=1 Tax=Actinophytocola gossypii TaxID=2812003 RepID=A0ABT2J3I1_9PSEU|nr:dihydrofolate reductase family protein [Actinophytocola gossypii]MCT2582419.1 dihydrofolate reductase family protein [Actinophytocola gossypii]